MKISSAAPAGLTPIAFDFAAALTAALRAFAALASMGAVAPELPAKQ